MCFPCSRIVDWQKILMCFIEFWLLSDLLSICHVSQSQYVCYYSEYNSQIVRCTLFSLGTPSVAPAYICLTFCLVPPSTWLTWLGKNSQQCFSICQLELLCNIFRCGTVTNLPFSREVFALFSLHKSIQPNWIIMGTRTAWMCWTDLEVEGMTSLHGWLVDIGREIPYSSKKCFMV